MKKVILSLVLLSSVNALAMGHDQDSVYSIYGSKAKKYFNKLPKVTSSCAYIENDVTVDGNTVDKVDLKIEGQSINSILCQHIGEQTYACEASTLWVSDACK
ncbi:MAG: hypothetical protein ACXVCP_02520 [Bdellovibrio sp.]